jgi:hypothetical protein
MATLAQLAQQYLNQGLPSISGIFQPRGPSIPTPVPVAPEPGITPRLLQPMGGGGDGFSVYNPDPNSISNKNYINPFPYDPMDDFGTSDYGYIEEPRKGIQGLFDQYVKGSLPAQLIGKGLDALGNMLPVNRRAIYENELGGQGIMVNDIGQIVSDGGNINTAGNIMAGYNAAKVDADTFAKRRKMIEDNMKDPVQKAAKLKALAEAEAIMLGTTKKSTDAIFDQKLRDKGLTPLTDQIAMNQAKLDFQKLANSDDDDDFDITSILDPTSKKNIIKNKEKITNQIFQKAINDVKQKEIAKQKQIEKIQKANIPATPGFDVSGGGIGGAGGYDQGKDYSGASDKTAGDRARTRDSRKSDLGFSDVRLKENVELIGKSPSNINIYKFNYKDNPTTYQGAMAHEVPWASIKHSNGYMMIDYNQIDVEFKKWQK